MHLIPESSQLNQRTACAQAISPKDWPCFYSLPPEICWNESDMLCLSPTESSDLSKGPRPSQHWWGPGSLEGEKRRQQLATAIMTVTQTATASDTVANKRSLYMHARSTATAALRLTRADRCVVLTTFQLCSCLCNSFCWECENMHRQSVV